MARDNITDISEKIKAKQETEPEIEVHKKAAQNKVTDPILQEKLIISHSEKKKFSIKDLLR